MAKKEDSKKKTKKSAELPDEGMDLIDQIMADVKAEATTNAGIPDSEYPYRTSVDINGNETDIIVSHRRVIGNGRGRSCTVALPRLNVEFRNVCVWENVNPQTGETYWSLDFAQEKSKARAKQCRQKVMDLIKRLTNAAASAREKGKNDVAVGIQASSQKLREMLESLTDNPFTYAGSYTRENLCQSSSFGDESFVKALFPVLSDAFSIKLERSPRRVAQEKAARAEAETLADAVENDG